MGRLEEDEKCFNKVCLCRILSAWLPDGDSVSFLQNKKDTVHVGVLFPAFKVKSFFIPAVNSLAQNNPDAQIA